MNKSIRFILGLRRNVHISSFRNNLSWLTVANRRKYFMGIFIYKLLRNNVPPYISDLFRIAPPPIRPSRLPSPLTFFIAQQRTSTLQKSFILTASHFWHSLPTSITSSDCLSTFKRVLHEFLLNLQHQ